MEPSPSDATELDLVEPVIAVVLVLVVKLAPPLTVPLTAIDLPAPKLTVPLPGWGRVGGGVPPPLAVGMGVLSARTWVLAPPPLAPVLERRTSVSSSCSCFA